MGQATGCWPGPRSHGDAGTLRRVRGETPRGASASHAQRSITCAIVGLFVAERVRHSSRCCQPRTTPQRCCSQAQPLPRAVRLPARAALGGRDQRYTLDAFDRGLRRELSERPRAAAAPKARTRCGARRARRSLRRARRRQPVALQLVSPDATISGGPPTSETIAARPLGGLQATCRSPHRATATDGVCSGCASTPSTCPSSVALRCVSRNSCSSG